MILRNARLAGEVVDLRIEDGVIAEIGSALGEGADMSGRWVIPGLWDQHVHFSQWALHRTRVDLAAASSAAEAAAMVAAAPRPPAGLPLVGVGFRDGLWPDAPTFAALDAVIPDVPVVLLSGDLHCCWLNSAALRAYGSANHPTGLLREEECFAIVAALDDVPDAVLDEWVREAGEAAAGRGVVGIVDLEMTWGFEHWRRRMAAGFDSLRVRAGVYPQFLDRAIAEGLRTGDSLGDLLQVGPFKVITDGSLNTRTAYCMDPWPGLGEDRGMLTVEPERLVDLMGRATGAGLVPAIHAIGDAANSLVLDAFETLGCPGRIEHAQLVSAGDFQRFAQLGVTASVQPEHAMDDRDVADRFWAGRTDRSYAWHSLLDFGAHLVFGSDAPVAPLDPWVTAAAAVSRSRDGREPWHPEQRLTAADALAASVETTIAVGQPADLVITETNPYTATGEQLRTMQVAATLLGGRLTHTTL